MSEAPKAAPVQTNAAFRLHQFLSHARTLSQGGTHQQLAAVFGLPNGDLVGLLCALAQSTKMVDEVENLVKAIPDENHSMFLRGFDRLKSGLAAATNNSDFNQWKQSYIPQDVIDRLEFCGNLLSKHYSEGEISKDELQEITKQLQEVYDSVLSSNIASDLKLTILELLESIRRAVHEYRMKGVYPLKAALVSATGQLVLHRAEVVEAGNSKEKPTIDKLFGLLDRVDKVVALATKTKPLFAPFMKYYPMLQAAAEKVADKLK
jgi:hypothetical protein